MKSISLFVGVLIFILVFLTYQKSDFSDISYPASLKKVNYKKCTFTIEYVQSYNPKSKGYGKYQTKTLSLLGVENLSESECQCVEDALQLRSKKIQQFNYLDYPFFIVKEINNQFDITVEVNGIIGSKQLSFNKIVIKNRNNLCKKWSY